MASRKLLVPQLLAQKQQLRELEKAADDIDAQVAAMSTRASDAVSKSVAGTQEILATIDTESAKGKQAVERWKRLYDVRSSKAWTDTADHFGANAKQLSALSRAIGAGLAPNLPTMAFAKVPLPPHAYGIGTSNEVVDAGVAAAAGLYGELPDRRNTTESTWMLDKDGRSELQDLTKSWDIATFTLRDATGRLCQYVTEDDITVRVRSEDTRHLDEHFEITISQLAPGEFSVRTVYKYWQPLPIHVLREVMFDVIVLEQTILSLPLQCALHEYSVGVETEEYGDPLLDVKFDEDGYVALAVAAFNHSNIVYAFDESDLYDTFTSDDKIVHVQIVSDPFWLARLAPADEDVDEMVVVITHTATSWKAVLHDVHFQTTAILLMEQVEVLPIKCAFKIEGNSIVHAKGIWDGIVVVRYDIPGLVDAPQTVSVEVPLPDDDRYGHHGYDIESMEWSGARLSIGVDRDDVVLQYEDGALTALHFQDDNLYVPPSGELTLKPYQLQRAFRVPSSRKHVGANLMLVHAEQAGDWGEIRLYDSGNCVGITLSQGDNPKLVSVADGGAMAAVWKEEHDKLVVSIIVHPPRAE